MIGTHFSYCPRFVWICHSRIKLVLQCACFSMGTRELIKLYFKFVSVAVTPV